MLLEEDTLSALTGVRQMSFNEAISEGIVEAPDFEGYGSRFQMLKAKAEEREKKKGRK